MLDYFERKDLLSSSSSTHNFRCDAHFTTGELWNYCLNPFPDVAGYIQHEKFILWCHFLQWPLEVGFLSTERVG